MLGSIIERVGPCRLEARRTGTHYDALVRSIVFQQLSGKAAGTIHDRFRALYPRNRPRPELVLATDDAALRGAGLSRQKIGYLRDLSARVVERTLPLAHLGRLPGYSARKRPWMVPAAFPESCWKTMERTRAS